MAEIRSILVHVDETAFCPARLAFAGELAARFDAALAALYLAPDVVIDPAAPGEATEGWAALVDARVAEARRRAEENFAAFRRHRHDVAWQAMDMAAVKAAGGLVPALATQARGADLVIVGQSGPGEERSGNPGTIPEELVAIAGRPVLAVPRAGHCPAEGKRVVVAWNDSREAARALADALPFLRRAERVCVITIGDSRPPAGDRPASMDALDLPLAWLSRHGITADGEIMRAEPAEIPDILLARAALLDADLLVMGAYGHGRIREMLLGGVTREVLARLPLPVLLAH